MFTCSLKITYYVYLCFLNKLQDVDIRCVHVCFLCTFSEPLLSIGSLDVLENGVKSSYCEMILFMFNFRPCSLCGCQIFTS